MAAYLCFGATETLTTTQMNGLRILVLASDGGMIELPIMVLVSYF